jgi:hypothetical protein
VGRLDTDFGTDNACEPGSFGVPPTAAVTCRIPGIIRPGEERAISIEWQTDSAEPGQSVDATIQWAQGEGKNTSTSYRDISLGEISSRSSWEFQFTEYPALLPLFAGLIGGLLVAFVQFWLARVAKGQEDRRAAAAKLEEESRAGAAKLEEERRAAAAKLEEESRAHLNTTWDLMLPESHKVATRHYVFLLSYVTSAIGSIEVYNAKSAKGTQNTAEALEAAERGFLSLTLFDRHVLFLYDSIGGVYLKSRMGEEILTWCLYTYQRLYWDRDLQTRGDHSALIRLIHPGAHIYDLQSLLHGTPGATVPPRPHTSGGRHAESLPVEEIDEENAPPMPINFETQKVCVDAKSRFDNWITQPECAKALLFLKGLRDILLFEMNRAYRFWYGGEPDLLEIDEKAREALLKIGSDFLVPEQATKLALKVKAYLEDAEKKGTAAM